MSQKWLSSNFYYVLMTPGHVEFLNKYINTLLIGLECASDFALKNIRKGYTWDDIRTAVDNIINHLDKKIFLEMSIISNVQKCLHIIFCKKIRQHSGSLISDLLG